MRRRFFFAPNASLMHHAADDWQAGPFRCSDAPRELRDHVSAARGGQLCLAELPVVLYDEKGAVLRDDLKGRQPDCPVSAPAGNSCDLTRYRLGSNGALFSPQGGLRASVEGLSVVGRLLLSGGLHRGQRFLAQSSIDAILTPHWRFDGSNGETESGFYCSYGLGAQLLPTPQAGCKDDLTGRGTTLAGHAGDTYRVRSGLWIDRKSKRGMAYFATGVAQDAPTGDTAYRTIEEWLARKAGR
jgi:hypothetical protein